MSILPRVGYVGMTHLGINYAVAGAAAGFPIVCFDRDASLIADLAAGRLPVREPDLPELLQRNTGRLHFTAAAKDLSLCDIVYIAPDVPTNDQGESDLQVLKVLIAIASDAMRPDACLVILSQVPPGFTRQLPRPVATLFYQVETLIFGRAVERATHPERFILGCADPAQPLPAALATYLQAFSCPILPMRYESAELAKIAINCCLVASVSTANTLAELCEKIGADWAEIIPALRLDQRIGAFSYISSGLGIAGGNLERDLATVVRFADMHGTDAGVVRAWMANSRNRRDWVLRLLHRLVLGKTDTPRLALWGLAYKQDTHSTKNSPALALLEALGPYPVTAYDPAVSADSRYHPQLAGASSALTACQDADALLIMTPWPEFRIVDPQAIADRMRGRIVVDPFSVLQAKACTAAGLQHHRLGTA